MKNDDNEFDEVLGTDRPVDHKGNGDGGGFQAPEGIWVRGLLMLVIAILSKLAQTVLMVVALVQFLWMLFAKEKNALLMEFGDDLGRWLSDSAQFLAGSTEDKPFPWAKWGS